MTSFEELRNDFESGDGELIYQEVLECSRKLSFWNKYSSAIYNLGAEWSLDAAEELVNETYVKYLLDGKLEDGSPNKEGNKLQSIFDLQFKILPPKVLN